MERTSVVQRKGTVSIPAVLVAGSMYGIQRHPIKNRWERTKAVSWKTWRSKMVVQLQRYPLAMRKTFRMVWTPLYAAKTGNIYVVTVSGKGDHKWSFSSTDMSIKNQKFPSFDPEIRSVCIDKLLNKILVGTKSSEIYLADYEEGSKNLEWDLLMAGHYADELWGLAVNPENPNVFATAGDDKTVRVWERNNDTGHVTLKHICKCRDMSRAIAWFDGNTILAGLGGRVGRKVITGKRKRRRKKVEKVAQLMRITQEKLMFSV